MKAVKGMFAVAALFAALSGLADTEAEYANGFTWYYRLINNNTEAEIYNNNNNIAISPDNRSDIVMPDTLGGKPVTSIGDYAFSSCKLMGITIPDGVTSIGIEAFYGCRNLKGVIIPDSVIFIGARAFSMCGAIKSVGIPQCVCTNQLSVVFPNAFSAITNIVIAEGVTDIGDSAFAGCSALNSITIPENVTNIAINAFSGCGGLTNVTMPATLRRTVEANGIFGDSPNVNIEYSSVPILHQVKSYDGIYDGAGHGIAVKVESPANAVIKYAYEEQGPYVEDEILFTNVIDVARMVWYTVDAYDGYLTATNSGTVIIRPKILTAEMVTVTEGSYTYNGKAKEPNVTVVDGEPSIITQDDYDVSYANNVNVGMADVIVTGKGNYIGTVTNHFIIGELVPCMVEVPSGMVSIAPRAYADDISIVEVILPEGLAEIGAEAFRGCVCLTNVMIPDSVTNIGYGAFSGCIGLTNVTIPENVTSIGEDAFAGCVGLTNLVIKSENVDLPVSGLVQAKFNSRFDRTSTIDEASERSVVSGVIAAYQRVVQSPWEFQDPIMGGTYTWNASNTTFAYFGQMFLEGGKTYVFGAHFDDDMYVKVDGQILINTVDCSSSSVLTGTYPCATSGWYDVEFRLGDNCGEKGSWGKKWTADFGLGWRDDGMTTTTQSQWKRLATSDAMLRIPSPFSGCANLKSITLASLNSSISAMFPDAYVGIEHITVTGEITSIPVCAFAGCVNLNSFTIPDTVTHVGNEAFKNCSGLTSITIPSNVASIGSEAFENCNGLAEIVFEGDAPSVGANAFSGLASSCKGIILRSSSGWGEPVSRTWNGLLITYPWYNVAFNANGGECAETSRIVDHGAAIGELPVPVRVGHSFDGWYSAKIGGNLIRADDVVTSDVQAYAHWTLNKYTVTFDANGGVGGKSVVLDHGTSLVLPNVTRTDYDFVGWFTAAEDGNEVLEGSTVTGEATYYAHWTPKPFLYDVSYGKATIRECSSPVGDIVIPSAVDGYPVVAIASNVFYGCSDLTSVTIPNSVTNIGRNAFYGCSDSLYDTSTILGVKLVDGWAVGYTSSISNCLELSGIRGIGDYAFRYCSYLTSVTIPNCVTNIGVAPFYGCSNIECMTVPFVSEGVIWGTDEVVGLLSFFGTWECGHDYEYGFGYIDTDGYIPSSLKTVAVTGGERIERLAFCCNSLTNVIMPDGVTSIGYSAFSGCSGLTGIVIPESVTNINASAFEGCSGLTDVTIPCNVKSIGSSAFSYCTGLTNFVIRNGVKSIGSFTFSGCSGLNSMTIPDSVTYIGYRAFSGCGSSIFDTTTISGLELVDGWVSGYSGSVSEVLDLTGIRGVVDSALSGYRGFTSVMIPQCVCNNRLSYVLPSAYQSITNVVVRGDVTNIVDNAFSGCSGLKSIYLPKDYAGVTSVFPSGATVCRYKPNQTVTFDANGGACETESVVVAFGSVYGDLPVPSRVEHSFSGWTLGGEPVSSNTVVSALDDHVLVAQWEINKYTVTFDANGGECGAETASVEYGAEIGALPVPTRTKAVFLGWFTEGEGGDKVNASFVVTGELTLHAHWLTEVAAPVIATTGGSTIFRVDSCEVEITCATEGVTIYYTDDGTTPKRNEDYLYTGPITITETTIFKAVAVIGDVRSDYTTVTITKKLLTLNESLDVDEWVTVATGEAVPWTPVFDSTAKVGDATARSGAIGNRTNTWLSATVSGAGTMTFWCKTSCEHDEDNTFTWDRLMVYTNGVEIAEWRMDGETGWTQRTLAFAGGENTVRWVYFKDRTGAEGEDCAWVDAVTWTPAGVTVPIGGKSVMVPQTWFDSHAEALAEHGGDRDAYANSTAANGRMSVAECYVVGLDPEIATNDFTITSFPMKADGTPDLDAILSSIDPPQSKWNVSGARPVLKGAANLDAEFEPVTEQNKSSFRFFRVEIELP